MAPNTPTLSPTILLRLPIVLWFILVLSVTSLSAQSDSRRGQTIGEVNGTKISRAEFEAAVSAAIEYQRSIIPDDEIDEQSIRQQIWDQMVTDILLQQAADRMGIRISDEEFQQMLLYDPPEILKQQFIDSVGVFQQALYHSFITDVDEFLAVRGFPASEIVRIEEQVSMVRNEYRKDRLRQAIQDSVAASAIPSATETFEVYKKRNSSATGTLAMLDADLIPDTQVTVSDSEARKYFDGHRGGFQQRASREISYAIFPLAPSREDSGVVARRMSTMNDELSRARTKEERDALFVEWTKQHGTGSWDGTRYATLHDVSSELHATLLSAQPGTIIGPVRYVDELRIIGIADIDNNGQPHVRAQHILLRTTEDGDDRSVKARADKILERARSGESFDQLVREYSEEAGAAERGGDLGYFRRGMMVEPFEKASFDAAPGSIVGPVKTQYGYHVIKVNDRTSKSFRLYDWKITPQSSGSTRERLRACADEFRSLLSQEVSIDSLGRHKNIQVVESGPIGRNQPVDGSMALGRFAYSGSVGDRSQTIVLNDGSLVVAQITKINKAGIMEYADAREAIVRKLQGEKKLDRLKDRATRLREALSPGKKLSTLSSVDQSVRIQQIKAISPVDFLPSVGYDSSVVAAVFSQKIGVISPAIRGERGYYIVLVKSRKIPTEREFAADRDTFIKELTSERRFIMFVDWLEKEREQAEIKDYRTHLQ